MGDGTDGRYGHIARAVFDTPWLIREAEGSVITALVRGRLSGDRLDPVEIAARIEAARARQGPRMGVPAEGGPVAVIPIYGVLAPRISLVTEMSGGTSLDAIRSMMADALANADISAIVAEFDSPGGSVEGVEELASWIREQRGQKPMVAVSNTMAASAAYYLASQFDEIVASPSSLTGNIGVFTEHVESSQADAADGIKTTIVRAPASKHDINRHEPLTDEGLAHLQSLVDDFYGQFVNAVAKGRGVTPDAVRSGYGQGRELTAVRARAAGLVDRIDTLDATVRRMSSGRGRSAISRAEADFAWQAVMQAALVKDLSTVPEVTDDLLTPTPGSWARQRVALAIAQAEHDFEIGDHADG